MSQEVQKVQKKPDAVFEIKNINDDVVDTITTDSEGVATTKTAAIWILYHSSDKKEKQAMRWHRI